MRPPEHWHLGSRRRRRLPLLWLLVLVAGVTVAIAAIVQVRSSGGDRSLASIPKGCESEACLFVAPVEASRPAPAIAGLSAAVVEDSCGALLYSKNGDARLRPASLTKLETALVAIEESPDLTRVVEVEINGALLAASTNSTIMGLEPGMRLTMRDLLAGLLLVSGNDAAIAIADEVAGNTPDFVVLMNANADELGLGDTTFTNPHGLDEAGLLTSAVDVAILGRAMLAEPELAALVAAQSYLPDWDRGELTNGNELLALYPGTVGIKVGFTDEAGETIVAAADRDGRRLIVSVLGSTDRYADAIALLDWGFSATASACGV